MDGMSAGVISALWFGILTSISPCPLATNIAAISFLSKRITSPRMVLLSGLAYTAGRMSSYAVLGFIIISSLLSVPVLANFLQKYMNRALGPILILTGLVLLDIIKFVVPGFTIPQRHQEKLAGSGAGGAFLLGLVFALAFCPVSAALFFGSLIPLALNNKSGPLLPFIYGTGTGIPVLVFAFMIALGVKSLGRWFGRLARLEYYMRKITGALFVLIGLYYFVIFIFGIH